MDISQPDGHKRGSTPSATANLIRQMSVEEVHAQECDTEPMKCCAEDEATDMVTDSADEKGAGGSMVHGSKADVNAHEDTARSGGTTATITGRGDSKKQKDAEEQAPKVVDPHKWPDGKLPKSVALLQRKAMNWYDQMVPLSGSCLDLIVGSMVRFPGVDGAMHEWVCAALAKWARNDHHRRIIVESGGFEVALRAMRLYPNESGVLSSACRALGNLCRDSASNAVLMGEMGGVVEILKAMRNCGEASTSVHVEGCRALVRSFMGCAANRREAVDGKALDLALRGMQAHRSDADAQKMGCRVLWYSCEGAEFPSENGKKERKEDAKATLEPSRRQEEAAAKTAMATIASSDAVSTVLDGGLRGHPTDESVQKWSLAVLSRCVRAEAAPVAAVALASSGADDVVEAMFRYGMGQSCIVEHGATILYKLAEYDDRNVYSVAETHGLIRLLVSATWTHREDVAAMERVCALLFALAVNERLAWSLAGGKGVSAVVSTMMTHGDDADLERQACLCLLNVANHPRLRLNVGVSGGLVALIEAMRMHPDDRAIQMVSCLALQRLIAVRENLFRLSEMEQARSILEGAEKRFPKQCGKVVGAILSSMASVEDEVGLQGPDRKPAFRDFHEGGPDRNSGISQKRTFRSPHGLGSPRSRVSQDPNADVSKRSLENHQVA